MVKNKMRVSLEKKRLLGLVAAYKNSSVESQVLVTLFNLTKIT